MYFIRNSTDSWLSKTLWSVDICKQTDDSGNLSSKRFVKGKKNYSSLLDCRRICISLPFNQSPFLPHWSFAIDFALNMATLMDLWYFTSPFFLFCLKKNIKEQSCLLCDSHVHLVGEISKAKEACSLKWCGSRKCFCFFR